MMNKCRGRIVQGDYIMGNIFHEKKKERGRKNTVAIKITFVLFLLDLITTFTSSDREFIHVNYCPIH